MNIYIFKRSDGSEWADYRLPEGAMLLQQITADSEFAIAKVANKETGRVRALAQRALHELRQTPAAPVTAPVPNAIRERNFWQRLKWAFTRK